jgi:tripartite-type tricarboxylate transporter receptor subunit TctC
MTSRIASVFAALLAVLAFGAAAQDKYPNRTVKIIVPYPAGQATDIATRIVGEALAREWGQAVVIENIGGGAAIPGVVTAKNANPDGYTLLAGTSAAMVVNPAIIDKLPYDPFGDFVLVGPVFRNPLIIVANDKAPYKTLKDIVDAARKNPGKLNWGYPGAGTTQHLTGELFKSVAGVDITGVMYKGSAQVVQDLLGNQIELAVDGIPAHLPHIKSGKERAIASTGSSRAPQLPDLPTVAELGYPGFSGEGWGGIVAPKGTPNEIVMKVSNDIRKVLSDPAMQKRIIDAGLVVDNVSRDEWIAFAKKTLVVWGDVARKNNIKVQ